MSITLSTGVTLDVAKVYATALAFTAATNSSEVTLTTTGSTLAAGDYVEVNVSSWGLLDKRLARVKTGSTATSVILEGINTSDQNKYPGASTTSGTLRKVTTWSQITQVKGLSASGGEQQFADITSITDVVARQMPTIRGAVSMTVDVYDDPALAWYADVNTADEARIPYGLKLNFPNGSKLVANAYWSLMKIPTMSQNEALMTQITLSYAAEPVRYAS